MITKIALIVLFVFGLAGAYAYNTINSKPVVATTEAVQQQQPLCGCAGGCNCGCQQIGSCGCKK